MDLYLKIGLRLLALQMYWERRSDNPQFNLPGIPGMKRHLSSELEISR